MIARTLPVDCPCPWVRYSDGGPWIYRPDPHCRRHSRPRRGQNATVTPIREADR